jgi:hypothetical protein
MYAEEEAYRRAVERLVERFGLMELEGEAYEFDFTDYYEGEMGAGLWKRFVVFKEPIEREKLADIKLFTNDLERELAVEGRRRVNIDPGYLTKASLILATTKDFPHRIYLREGIYAEVTLTFKKNTCSFFDWTYPDFRTPEVCNFFLEVRKKIKE